MAELQQRARAFDLAIENIYTRTRRVLARHAGVDYNSSRSEIASRIARVDDRCAQLETLMRRCETSSMVSRVAGASRSIWCGGCAKSKEISACACVRAKKDKQQKTFESCVITDNDA
jgi:hypothetical protein